jgi:hypothetical protein
MFKKKRLAKGHPRNDGRDWKDLWLLLCSSCGSTFFEFGCRRKVCDACKDRRKPTLRRPLRTYPVTLGSNREDQTLLNFLRGVAPDVRVLYLNSTNDWFSEFEALSPPDKNRVARLLLKSSTPEQRKAYPILNELPKPQRIHEDYLVLMAEGGEDESGNYKPPLAWDALSMAHDAARKIRFRKQLSRARVSSTGLQRFKDVCVRINAQCSPFSWPPMEGEALTTWRERLSASLDLLAIDIDRLKRGHVAPELLARYTQAFADGLVLLKKIETSPLKTADLFILTSH